MKPRRSRHCHYCDKCVNKFDHHCQWLSTCIGAKNLGLFYLLIMLLLTDIILIAVLNISAIVGEHRGKFSRVVCLSIAVSSLVFCLFIGLALLYLFYVQTVNMCKGLTTSERYSTNRDRDRMMSGGWVVNCRNMCLNSDSPKERKISTRDSMRYEVIVDNI